MTKLTRLLALLLLLVLLCQSPSSASSLRAKVDARVIEETESGQSSDFIVLLRSQANLNRIPGEIGNDHAREVVGRLQETADTSQSSIRSLLDSEHAAYRSYWVADLLVVHAGRNVIDSLVERPDILAIESDAPFRVAVEQPVQSEQEVGVVGWNLERIGAPDMWAMGYTGQGRVYANADTGVMWDHPALKEHYRGWDGLSANHNYNWWDAVHADLSGDGANPCTPGGFIPLPASGSNIPCDDAGHGTHTVGIGVGDDGAGSQIGVAPGAKWIACRNMEQNVGRPSTYIECLQFFMAPTDLSGNNPDPSKRADVIGNSYGCPPSESCAPNTLHAALASVRAAGIFLAASAGNQGASGCGTINDPPALDDEAITVGATDNNDVVATFSSRGPVTVDGSNRVKPDLMAPGTGILSSYPSGGYVSLMGTSMAAPHVAAGVALLWTAFPELRGNVDRTEMLLKQTAISMLSGQACGGDSPNQVPNNVYGSGRIDLTRAYFLERAVNMPFKIFFPLFR